MRKKNIFKDLWRPSDALSLFGHLHACWNRDISHGLFLSSCKSRRFISLFKTNNTGWTLFKLNWTLSAISKNASFIFIECFNAVSLSLKTGPVLKVNLWLILYKPTMRGSLKMSLVYGCTSLAKEVGTNLSFMTVMAFENLKTCMSSWHLLILLVGPHFPLLSNMDTV